MTQRDDFQCDVRSVAYNFERRLGTLTMADGNCCDMAGCLQFFVVIDPEVERIETFSGAAADTIYFRRHGGEWRVLAADGREIC